MQFKYIVPDTHYKGSWSTHSSGQTQGMYFFPVFLKILLRLEFF